MKKLIAALLLSLSMLAPSFAAELPGYVTTEKTITFSPGGSLLEFIEKYNDDRMRHVHYRIDGLCISACTTILGLIPWSDICATARGTFGFHSASLDMGLLTVHSPEATRLLGQTYPPVVKELLKERGFDVDAGQEHPDLVYVPATTFVRACNGNS
jgi:hypothetical protein